MRKKWKVSIIIFFILSAIVILAIYKPIKKDLLYRTIKQTLEAYVDKRYGAKLLIGNIRGNIISNLYLNDTYISGIKGLPEELRFKIKSIKFKHGLIDLIRPGLAIEIQDPELRYKSLILPFEVYQRNKLITIKFEENFFNTAMLENLFVGTNCLSLEGLCNFKGEIILEEFKPKTFDIKFKSDKITVFCQSQFKAKLSFDLILDGNIKTPYLTGAIFIDEGNYFGEGFGNGLKNSFMTDLGAMDILFLDIMLKGNNIEIENDSLSVVLKADLKIKKESQKALNITGKIESKRGAYLAYQNKFKIKRAEITFNDGPIEKAQLDILGEARVRRYSIFASIKGSVNESRLDITSKPELSRHEIMTLLLFGKKIKELNPSEKNELLVFGDMTSSFVSKFFFGKAEANIAQMLGVDDFSVQTNINEGTKGMHIPSVEVGKYLGSDKLYGTYRIETGIESINNKRQAKQSVSGEYNFAENLIVKGEHIFNESINLPQEDKVSVEFKWKF